MEQPINIAVAGLGTVGAGTLGLLERHAGRLAARAGRVLQVAAVSSRDRGKDRGVDLSQAVWYDDAVAMAREAEAAIFVELIGGSEGIAKAAVEAALDAGKDVVTANKALIAHHGAALARRAAEKGCTVAYEAAVAGGIPIIKTLREGMAANEVSQVYGILNGTCNYILTTMRETGRDFDVVLAEAQRLGYAEADPGFDIDGVDAAHKLAILAALAFGSEVSFEDVFIEGIRHITAFDIASAEELGYRIKLLGIARQTDEGLEQRVHACMVRKSDAIAAVEGVTNAVVAQGDFVGSIVSEGAGAGAGPTASAVVADIVDLARGNRLPPFVAPGDALAKPRALAMEERRGCYYIRLTVRDQPGVIATVAAALRDAQISMESMIQHGRGDGEGEPVPVVIITHETVEAQMRQALGVIARDAAMIEAPCMIRIEAL